MATFTQEATENSRRPGRLRCRSNAIKHDGHNHRRLGLCTAAYLGLVFAAWAAPTQPGNRRLSDEYLCLRGVKKVSIEVIRLPDSLDSEDARRKIERHFRQSLLDNGFEVDQTVTTPALKLQCWTAIDPSAPDSVALTTLIGAYQKVTVHRLEQDLVLPGASIVQTAIGPSSELADMLLRDVRRATVLLAQVVALSAR